MHHQLEYQPECWQRAGMAELRKVTVQVAEHDLAMAQAYTGAGVTDLIGLPMPPACAIPT
jgi:hypothetical protein